MTSVGTGDDQIPAQGNTIRNIIEGADIVMSHILHFYHLAALDYINTSGTAVDGAAPWANGKDNTPDMVTGGLAQSLVLEYVTALDIRRKAHTLGCYLSGKQPCTPALIPGGVTQSLTNSATGLAAITNSMTGMLSTIKSFIDNTYIPTVVAVAGVFSPTLLTGPASAGVGRGCKKFLAYGTFPQSNNTQALTGGFADCTGAVGTWAAQPLHPANIEEHIVHSYYNEASGANNLLHPSVGVTDPAYGKSGAYSWLKAPRYNTSGAGAGAGTSNVAEVGPLARMIVNTLAHVEPWASTVNTFITGTLGLPLSVGYANLPSVLGRHAARALECQGIATLLPTWIADLATTTATGQTYRHRNLPTSTTNMNAWRKGHWTEAQTTGYGLTEAPRGALGHWISVSGKKITKYQCVVPTTWNMGPMDTYGNNGPIEQALLGTAVPVGTAADAAMSRTKVGRIVRSFDPCIACAVHIVSPDKEKSIKFEVVPPGVIGSCK